MHPVADHLNQSTTQITNLAIATQFFPFMAITAAPLYDIISDIAKVYNDLVTTANRIRVLMTDEQNTKINKQKTYLSIDYEERKYKQNMPCFCHDSIAFTVS